MCKVWNQIRPPWYEAILNFVTPLLKITSDAVIKASQNGATVYQAMSLIIACFSTYWECTHPSLLKITALLQEILPADVVPINRSCLFQVLCSALYAHFLSENKKNEIKESISEVKNSTNNNTDNPNEALVLTLAEALCSIDEANKHNDQIDDFLKQVSKCAGPTSVLNKVESNEQIVEILISDIMTSDSGKRSLQTLYHFIRSNSEWLYQKLGVSEEETKQSPKRATPTANLLTNTMFYVGYRPFDQVSLL